MEDAVTSNLGMILAVLSWLLGRIIGRLNFSCLILSAAPPQVIDLPDDDEETPLRTRRNRKAPAGKVPQSTPVMESAAQEGGNTTRNAVTFADPLTSAQPSSSTKPPPTDASSPFAAHHVPEDQVGAAKEAIRQAGLMMEQMKVVREASQATYDASSALQTNVQVS